MTPKEQRIAIAEACGWERIGSLTKLMVKPGETGTRGRFTAVPDYLADLNAMHEAEKTLTDAQRGNFAFELAETLGVHDFDDCGEWFRLVTATAAQRAEAFLRTLNLWKD